MASDPDQPERPRQEPEIFPPETIPPGSDWRDRHSAWPRQGYAASRGTHRIYVGRIGPLGFAILILIVAMFGGVLLLAIIGAALIWLPILVVLAVIAAISALVRRL